MIFQKSPIADISILPQYIVKNVVYFKNSLQKQPFTVEVYSSFMVPKNCQEYIYRIYSNDSYNLDYAKSLWNEVIKS